VFDKEVFDKEVFDKEVSKKEIIKKVIYDTVPFDLIESIIIFGSQARNEGTKDSDTDICIVFKEELSRDDIKHYRTALNKMFAFDHHMATDIIMKSEYVYNRYKGVIGGLEYDIAREGIVL